MSGLKACHDRFASRLQSVVTQLRLQSCADTWMTKIFWKNGCDGEQKRTRRRRE